MIKVTVVIPVKNEEEKVVECIESINAQKKCQLFFVVVDDSSTDETVTNVSKYFESSRADGVLLSNTLDAKGAGICRNLGMEKIPHDTDYVIFFDADDLMPKYALDKLTRLAEVNDSDVVVASYQTMPSENKNLNLGLLPGDKRIWKKILENRENRTLDPRNFPELLATTNYPWNKLIKYSYFKKINLKFSGTTVHNDVYAHWVLLIYAKTVTLTNFPICKHFVVSQNDQLTNVSCKKRLQIFEVLDEVEQLLRSSESMFKLFYGFFLIFKMNTLEWAYKKINDELKDEFLLKAKNSYSLYSSSDALKVSMANPKIATKSALLKLGVESLK